MKPVYLFIVLLFSMRAFAQPDSKLFDEELKDFLFATGTVGKKEMIVNIDTNYKNIAAVKTYFNKIVPPAYLIYIEFNDPMPALGLKVSIDARVSKKGNDGQYKLLIEQWNVELGSPELDNLLKTMPLTKKQLAQLETYLDKAQCISVTNGSTCEIGFARRAMAKYFYLLFDGSLTKEQKAGFSKRCSLVVYNDSVVLKYDPGYGGLPCFPDGD